MRIRHIRPIQLSGGALPPSEFLIFKAGENATSKGVFIFDAAAAEAVMADYAAQGNELAIDYDHAMLATGSARDPALAGRAAGWFTLELRGGDLWAVNVRWTEPARAALSAKEWRYTSPAFLTDSDNRITALVNVALTNIPATKHMSPLMAASRLAALNGVTMDPELMQKALDALLSGDADACAEILKAMIVSAASGGAPTEETPADPAAEEQASGDPAAPEEEKPPAALAAASRILALSGRDSLSTALETIEGWRKDSITLSNERAKLAADRAALEAAERDQLGAKLVTKCGMNPAAVWAKPLEANDPKKRKLSKAFASMALSDLREFVELNSKPGATESPAGAPKPPVTAANEHGLNDYQMQLCKDLELDPATYARARGIKK